MVERDMLGVKLLGQLKDKLIDRKQEWAKEGRLLTGKHAPREQRLPPGQRQVHDWPVLDLGVQPNVSLSEFKLLIDGAVANPVTLDWNAVMALPQHDSTSDMHCVTQWSRFDNHWRGVAASTLLQLVHPNDDATHVSFESYVRDDAQNRKADVPGRHKGSQKGARGSSDPSRRRRSAPLGN